MITREQVADLQPGDVVELRSTRWPAVSGQGPVTWKGPGSFGIGPWTIASGTEDWTLTVASRVPRPLYVNHHRTKPVPGDMVRAEADGGRLLTLIDGHGWLDAYATEWDPKRKDRLRLLVDGETGQVVP